MPRLRCHRRWHQKAKYITFVRVIMFSAVVFPGFRGNAQLASEQSPIRGELSASSNPHYFKDASGAALILTGSQTWNTFQDWGTDGSPQVVDFDAFVKFLSRHGHNFTLLWTVEMPKFCGLPSTGSAPPDFTVSPLPWKRTGPGTATDGGPKFDLTQFNQVFFDRLRTRAQSLNTAGIYAGVYLFTGEFLHIFRCSSDGYPLTGTNNINGIDDGYSGIGKVGVGAIDMTSPNAITRIQDAYVEKMIDTLNDLPNVLWIVSEEASSDSIWWNNHQIAHIRAYESEKGHQHPIGYAAPIGVKDSIIYSSDADWVAPYVDVSPASSCGTGKPACKVNVNDSDHSYFEMWIESPQQNRNYAWENFTTGNQVLFMDPYVVYYPRENRNLCVSPSHSICREPDRRYENFRDNLGYILKYSHKLNLMNASPRDSLCSTGYCLAQTPPVGAEYLIYSPGGGVFTVDLSAMPRSRTLAVEWFNPSNAAIIAGKPVSAGASAQVFTPPFTGDAVLYLVDIEGHATSRGD